MAELILTHFDRFTESEYHKTPEEIITDLKDDEKAREDLCCLKQMDNLVRARSPWNYHIFGQTQKYQKDIQGNPNSF